MSNLGADNAFPGGRRLNGELRETDVRTAATRQEGIVPVPGLPLTPATRRRRRRRPRWYRRPLVMVPIVVLLLAAGSLLAASAMVGSTLSAVQTVSTPPPQVSGDVFGVGGNVVVDTGPAQAALQADANHDPGAAKPVASSGQPAGADASSTTSSTSNAAQASGGASSPRTAAPSKGKSGGGGFWGNVRNTVSGVGSMTSGAAAAVGITQQDEPSQGINILLMGVDARPGQALDIGVRPDALMVLHLNPANGSCRVLAIPRDTRTELPGYGLTKINHALAVGGIPYERQVVENFLGISIQHYGLIDFSGLTDLVDAVGGVMIDNDYAFTSNGVIFPLGPQHLNGADALTFSRYRYGPDGDFGRIRRQQMVIRALIKQGASLNVVTELNKLLPALQDHTRTDLTVPQMIAFAQKYGPTCTSTTLNMKELQGRIANFQDPMLHMELSYVVIDPKEVQTEVSWLLGKQ